MTKELRVAISTAMSAGKMIRSRLGKVRNVEYKGAINIVTDVDKKAEAMIIRDLERDFPEYGILSEERPEQNRGSKKWIIDPLDGTTNFAHGFPFFAVSIALEQDQEAICGVVYDPVHEELFFAEKGKGAFLNKKKIEVSRQKDIAKSFLATGFSYSFKERKDNNMDNFFRFMMASFAIRRAGSACLDLCYVACGRFDGFWEMDLFAWDMAAAGFIVQEAQGRVSGFDAGKYSHHQGNILASNGFIHKQMLDVLNKKS